MADWYYDMMAELGEADSGIMHQQSISELSLPSVLSVPVNDSNEINLDEYYSYAGYDETGHKVSVIHDETSTAYDYFQNNNNINDQTDDDVLLSDVGKIHQSSGNTDITAEVITETNQNSNNHNTNEQLNVPVITSQLSHSSWQQSAAEGVKPARASSLHHKLASNPYFSELFADGVAPPTLPTYIKAPAMPSNSTFDTNESSSLTHAAERDSSVAAVTAPVGGRDRTRPSVNEFDRAVSTTNSSLSPAVATTRKVLRYIPPTDVDPWGDADDDVAALTKLSRDMVFTKLVHDRSPTADQIAAQKVSTTSGAAPSGCEVSAQVGQLTQKTASGTGLLDLNSGSTSYTRSVFTLGGVIPTSQASAVLFSAGKAILFVKDQAVSNVSRYVAANMYISSFIGCVNESLYYAADRAKTYADAYLSTLTADDPERRHLARIKNSTHWQSILLRYSMASLTWKQRQLLEETRDGGTLDQMDLNGLMRDARSSGGSGSAKTERLMRIADEYFYITTGPDNCSNESRSNKYSTDIRGVNIRTSPGAADAAAAEPQEGGDSDGEREVETVVVHKNKAAFSSSGRGAEALDILGGDAARSTVAMEFIQSNIHAWLENEAAGGDDDAQFALATFFTAPKFSESTCCYVCMRNFGITLFRHHCRFCGLSVCEDHSKDRRCIYRYGMIQPVRVCGRCRVNIDEIHRRDTLIWRESRVQAYLNGRLIPYFNPTVDRGIDKALRIADYSIIVAKNTLALNFPTKVVIETVDILKRYGLSGFAGLLLRQDFLESVETLKRISGMDAMFSMSLHELTACIYYKLAIDRGLRGCNPEGERIAHAPHIAMNTAGRSSGVHSANRPRGDSDSVDATRADDFDCDAARSEDIDKAIRFAPLALKIVYEINPVDAQRLAKSQGWETIFSNAENDLQPEQPCYILFANELPARMQQQGHERGGGEDSEYRSSIRDHKGGSSAHKAAPKRAVRREAVLAIRGTKTIQDVVTDIRAAPQEFPPPVEEITAALNGECDIGDSTQSFGTGGKGTSVSRKSRRHSRDGMGVNSEPNGEDSDDAEQRRSFSSDANESPSNKSAQWEWLNVSHTSTYACGGFSRAAMHVLREVGPSLMALYREGYEVTIVGHSLGGGVAALLTYMLKSAMPSVYCVTYGCPSCVDAVTADVLKSHVLTVINHDDVISRITPQSIRGLMSELMTFREQVFRHLQQDWSDVMRRAYSLWSPRWRQTHSAEDMTASSARSAKVFKALHATKHNSLATSGLSVAVSKTAVQPGGGMHIDVQSPGTSSSSSSSQQQRDGGDESLMVVVEQEILPDLWVPGRIIHLFLHKGQYHASEVSRTFPDIRRIEVQGNMFEDHRSKSTLDALLETRAVRHAPCTPPDWIPYSTADVCFCCHNSFTWHSTFRGDAQEYRDRYNCKHCGNVVCGPCSKGRRAIPKYGMIFDERICDHCLYKGDFAIVR